MLCRVTVEHRYSLWLAIAHNIIIQPGIFLALSNLVRKTQIAIAIIKEHTNQILIDATKKISWFWVLCASLY